MLLMMSDGNGFSVSAARSWRYLVARVRWVLPPRADYETVVENRPDARQGTVVNRIHAARRGTGRPLCGATSKPVVPLHQAWSQEFEYLGHDWGPKTRSRFPRCPDCVRLLPAAEI